MTVLRCLLLVAGLWLLAMPGFAQPPKPGLYVLSVGVSNYKNPKYNLKYAHKDALDLAEAWRSQTDLYDVREVKTLVNEQATRANIRAALNDLKRKVSPTSFLVFIFSGHGLNDALVTYEFDNDDRTATTLGRSDLTQQLTALGGNYIALLDACHSGSFAKNFSGGGKDISDFQAEQSQAIKSLLRALSSPDKANIVIGSSSSSEKSDECDACQNGYFTQCLLDAFDGKSAMDGQRAIRPDVDGNGYVETNELDAYIKEAVFVTTRDKQFSQNVLAQQTIGYPFSILKPKNSTGSGRPVVYESNPVISSNKVPERTNSDRNSVKAIEFIASGLPQGVDRRRNNDDDSDGIPNRFDTCPDQLGELKFWGCATDPEPNSKWSQYSNGVIPTGAVLIGRSPEGKPRYLVRVNYYLGYIEQGSTTAKIQVSDSLVSVNVYDVLHKGRFRWKSISKSSPLPGNYVSLSNKFKSPVIKATYEQQDYPGTWARGTFSSGEQYSFAEIAIASRNRFRPENFSILLDEDAPVNDVAGSTAMPFPDVRVVRWVSPVTKDFETLREDFNPDTQLQDWGYKDKLYQFSAYKTRPNDPNATGVNRWVMPNCAASIVIAEHEIPEATLLSWGYKSKQFLFYAYRSKPATGDFVAVNRWINAKPQGDKCRDFTLTIAETELTDAQLRSYGYTDKRLQFYVPRP